VQTYSEDLKKTMVRKITTPGGPSATALSEEVGIAQPTLSRWVREMGEAPGDGRDRMPLRPQEWSAERKVKAVAETSVLSELEVGAYLRREGLHSHHLQQWRNEMLEAIGKSPTATARKKTELAQAKKRIRDLERELRRKDKALAEATARLILKKKAALIWGPHDEDDESK
jgi:transposase-like protein